MVGLTLGSYEAYCFDQAVWFLGSRITQELDKVGEKKDRKQVAREAARMRKLKSLLGQDKKEGNSGFADPAALFTDG